MELSSSPLQLAYFQHEVKSWAQGAETMIMKPFEQRIISDEGYKENILDLLTDRQAVNKRDFRSDTELAKSISLTRDRFRELVDELIEEGQLVEEENNKKTTVRKVK